MTSQGPDNWEVNFKPAYEDKYISSLRLKANQSQSVAVEVSPYVLAKPGEYPIRVKVSSSEAKGGAALTVALTGTQKLDAGTSTGLLSLTAVRGEPANLSVYVKNSGSATLSNLRFLSFKAENWKVEVKPERIVFTRHYFRYEKEKIPALMALHFPQIEYFRTKDHGAITCETDGKVLHFDLTIR